MEGPEPPPGVVEDAIEDHPHPAVVGAVEQLAERGVAAEQGIDREVVVRVIAVVGGRLEDRRQVDGGDPQVLEVVEVLHDAAQVAALEPELVGGASHGSRTPGLWTPPLAANRSGKIW